MPIQPHTCKPGCFHGTEEISYGVSAYPAPLAKTSCSQCDGAGCIYCCSACNLDRHFRRGCGAIVSHGEIACDDCNRDEQSGSSCHSKVR